jgi:N-acetylmuramoyl-L-alanine amidase
VDRTDNHRIAARTGERKGVARLLAIIVVVAVAIAVPLSIGASESRVASSPPPGQASQGDSPVADGTGTVIAWNPSHQADTGTDGWREYTVCGDIAKRAMALLPDVTNVLGWETGMGLTSRSESALESECGQANAAHAQIFIAVHVNGGAASGFTGVYYTGDSPSARYAEALLRSVATTMGMTFHYVRPRSDLYVLDPVNNQAPIRVLLEVGDNVADRELLTSEKGRQRLAAALAKAVRENAPSTFRYEQGDTQLAYTGAWTVDRNSSACGGSFRYANNSGASVTVTFTGTRLSWIAKKSPSYGKAKVTVDGGDPVVVDLYSTTTLNKQKVWSTRLLARGNHTVKIEWTGTKNAAATDTNINLDALDLTGALR